VKLKAADVGLELKFNPGQSLFNKEQWGALVRGRWIILSSPLDYAVDVTGILSNP